MQYSLLISKLFRSTNGKVTSIVSGERTSHLTLQGILGPFSGKPAPVYVLSHFLAALSSIRIRERKEKKIGRYELESES